MGKKTRSRANSEDSDDKYNDLLLKYSAMETKLTSLMTENNNLRERLETLEHGNGDTKVNPPVQLVNCAIGKDSIPIFEAKTPSSQPLKRNSEVDFFLTQVELASQCHDDTFLIRSAKSRCRGIVASIVNSPIFDEVNTWAEFKELIRKKFRGTASASDYLNFLSAQRLEPNQSPQDLYVQIQSYVYQAVRDYPTAIGDVDELISRTFLQALPMWLRELIVSSENLPNDKLVEVANRVWNLKFNSKTNVGLSHVASTSATSKSKYCAYHRCKGHTTTECRAKPSSNVCWRCGNTDHVRKNCPFSQNQAQEANGQENSRESH